MSELKKIAEKLKDAAKGLVTEIAKIDNQIKTLQEQRHKITSDHVSKDDYLAYLKAHFKIKADRFEIDLLRDIEARNIFNFGSLERGFVNKDAFQGYSFLTSNFAPVNISENALYFYFGDMFIERIGDALEQHQWPDNAMPVTERRKAISDIEASIQDLEKQRSELVEIIDGAGISR